ncbi:MAG: hypothetical protein IT288_07785 [Bdellovibrionales bacterium]|nr:hypothetical protein [Bdellovibrionales bacterium]
MKQSSLTLSVLASVFLAMVVGGCGVKGDPLPPEKPPELGRGKPSYKRATEGMPYPTLPPIQGEDSAEDDEEKKNED